MRPYVNHYDPQKSHHRAWLQAVLNRLVELDPEALNNGSELDTLWRAAVETKAPLMPQRGEWITKIKALNLSQPDAVTCQATCIGMAVGDTDIQGIRRKLQQRGNPGRPTVMASVIRDYGKPYQLDEDASLQDVYSWLEAGEFLITHGWFTGSGHVICLDGLKVRLDSGRDLNVKDPWGEFMGNSWAYRPGVKFYDGFYSDRLIYATCVAGTSSADARAHYAARKVDTARGGMWVHRFLV